MKQQEQHHTIEIFSVNCPLCKHIAEDTEVARCELKSLENKISSLQDKIENATITTK